MNYDEQIKQLTISVWDAILRLPIEEEESALPTGQRTLSACVHITGAWNGALALTCGDGMAAESAAIMFDLEQAGVSIAEKQDALGELANMIGGNVKGLLPEHCHLSLPVVVEGIDYSFRVPGSRQVSRIPMRSGEHRVTVSLLQSEAAAA